MCNFNKQSDTAKDYFSSLLKETVATLGGVNFFLALVELVRKTKPHPLISSKCELKTEQLNLKWNKTIFKEPLADYQKQPTI